MNQNNILWKQDLEIPKNNDTSNQVFQWYASDRKRHFENHSVYKPNDISYEFNSLGYRSCEFDIARPKLLSIGCSTTFGLGLPKHEMFSEIIAEKLQVSNCNLSMPGKSNDYISRILQVALPIIKPSFVIVNFTYITRREYWTNEGELITYSQASKKTNYNLKKLEAINNQNENFSNLYKNFCFIKNLLKNEIWAFSCVEDYFDNINCDKSNYVGVLYNHPPCARDGHPGKISNWNLSQKYLNFFKKYTK